MKTELLTLLREADGYLSGQELCRHFGVSRTAVWKAVNQLKEAGYEIEAVQNKGYRLIGIPDRLSAVELNSIRKTDWLGAETFYYETIDSTNIRAKKLAEEGHPDGTLVVAEQQESGRGRRGRVWQSPPGEAIFMTWVLKPQIALNHAPMITLVAALAVRAAIEECTGGRAGIKWPNDIVMNGRKVCGILTEMSAQTDYINHIVVGVGINVNNTSFPEEIAQVATSLFLETGRRQNRAMLIEKVLEHFEQYYAVFLATEDLRNLTQEYNAGLANRGKKVRVLDPKEPFDGVAEGITDCGELIVATEEGKKLVSSGEVSVRGIYGYVR